MFESSSIRIGSLFGIPFKINVSWLVIFGLVAFSLGRAYFPSIPGARSAPMWQYYVVGAITALLFFASIVAHELSHSLVARLQGGSVESITLFIFGGVAQIEDEPETAGKEFLMASAGPAMSMLLAVVCFGAFALTASQGAPWWIWAPLEYLAGINFFVGLFNLLPGFPLDGGRVLRSILWGATHDLLRATRWAVRTGQVIGWSMVVLAVVTVLQGNSSFIWFGLIGWFITSLAGNALRQQELKSRVQGVPIERVMSPSPDYVDGDETLEAFVHEHVLARRHSRYPVMHEGSIVGLVTLPGVKSVDRAEWPFVRVIDVADRDLHALVVPADASLDTVLQRLAGERPGALLVVKEGRMVGIVTRSDVIELLNTAPA